VIGLGAELIRKDDGTIGIRTQFNTPDDAAGFAAEFQAFATSLGGDVPIVGQGTT
jgi:hypothetical protein